MLEAASKENAVISYCGTKRNLKAVSTVASLKNTNYINNNNIDQ